jgi:hypothetical protein
MFKRVNYSKRALSTFEIVGSFIVDLYYNHFYYEAKRIRIEGRVESITDGYKYAVKAYLNSFNNPDLYRKTIVGIHKYYYTTTKFNTISFSECVNEIVRHFVPDEFFETTTNQQRDGILRNVLMSAVRQFSSDVLCSNILDTIIDNHSDKSIVRNMQDKMVETLMFEREKMFQKIFNVSNKSAPTNSTIVVKLKSEIVALVKKNIVLISKCERLTREKDMLEGIVRKYSQYQRPVQEPVKYTEPVQETIQESVRYAEPVQESIREKYTEPSQETIQESVKYAEPVQETIREKYTEPSQETIREKYTEPSQDSIREKYTEPSQDSIREKYTEPSQDSEFEPTNPNDGFELVAPTGAGFFTDLYID